MAKIEPEVRRQEVWRAFIEALQSARRSPGEGYS